MQLSEIQKAEINSAASSGEFFEVVTNYRKRAFMLVIRRWKGDWYRNIALWEIDRSTFDEHRKAVTEYLEAKGKKVLKVTIVE